MRVVAACCRGQILLSPLGTAALGDTSKVPTPRLSPSHPTPLVEQSLSREEKGKGDEDGAAARRERGEGSWAAWVRRRAGSSRAPPWGRFPTREHFLLLHS